VHLRLELAVLHNLLVNLLRQQKGGTPESDLAARVEEQVDEARTRADARETPSSAEEGATDEKLIIDVLWRRCEFARHRRSVDAKDVLRGVHGNSDESQRATHDKGERRIEGLRSDSQEAGNLGRVGHAAHDQAETKEQTSDVFADQFEPFHDIRDSTTLALGESVQRALDGDARGEQFSVQSSLDWWRASHHINRLRRRRHVKFSHGSGERHGNGTNNHEYGCEGYRTHVKSSNARNTVSARATAANRATDADQSAGDDRTRRVHHRHRRLWAQNHRCEVSSARDTEQEGSARRCARASRNRLGLPRHSEVLSCVQTFRDNHRSEDQSTGERAIGRKLKVHERSVVRADRRSAVASRGHCGAPIIIKCPLVRAHARAQARRARRRDTVEHHFDGWCLRFTFERARGLATEIASTSSACDNAVPRRGR